MLGLDKFSGGLHRFVARRGCLGRALRRFERERFQRRGCACASKIALGQLCAWQRLCNLGHRRVGAC